MWGKWRFLLLVASLFVTGGMSALAEIQDTPDFVLDRLLTDARLEALSPGSCNKPDNDRLVRIFCEGRIKVGVREDYPLFGSRKKVRVREDYPLFGSRKGNERFGYQRSGYGVDVARAVASRLGVTPEFVRVVGGNRIPLLDEDRIDMVIATMGHNTSAIVRPASSARIIISQRPF